MPSRLIPTLLAASAAMLVGCSSGSKSHSTTTTIAPAPTLPNGVTGATSIPLSPPNNAKLRANVQIASCKAVAGGWAASGTALNPTTSAVTYTITVFFTATTATVLATGETKVDVKPGARQPWTVSVKFTAAPSTLCVLRGVG